MGTVLERVMNLFVSFLYFFGLLFIGVERSAQMSASHYLF